MTPSPYMAIGPRSLYGSLFIIFQMSVFLRKVEKVGSLILYLTTPIG